MLFEWQGILQFINQSGFPFNSIFFSFTVHCCFMATLKTSADTNAGQSHRLTHCIKNLHYYNLKSLVFKRSLLFIHTFKNTAQLLKTFLFVRQSLTNAISLPLIYSISSKRVFQWLLVTSAPEKKNWKLTLPVQLKRQTIVIGALYVNQVLKVKEVGVKLNKNIC